MPLSIEEAIKKYSGGDDAYALKLKEHIRNAMGYSNYKAKLQGAVDTTIDTGDVSKMDPATIARNRNAKQGIVQDNINSAATVVDKIDSTAGSLAEAQAARERAAAKEKQNAMGFNNGVVFQPKDKLDEMILAYQQNPKNPDGSVKSLQQFEAETAEFFSKDSGGIDFNDGRASIPVTKALDPQEIKNRISERVPKDFIGNEDKYSLMSQGYSEKQAKEFQGALRYDTMSAPEKLIYQVSNPEMAKKLESGVISKDLIQDIGTTTDPKTGQTVPKYSFEQLKEKYPNVSDSDLKTMIAPVEKKSMVDDISQWYTPDMKSAVEDMVGNEGYAKWMADDKYKELKAKLNLEYGGVFTDRDIDQIIYSVIRPSQ
jgi:hypothetical protein